MLKCKNYEIWIKILLQAKLFPVPRHGNNSPFPGVAGSLWRYSGFGGGRSSSTTTAVINYPLNAIWKSANYWSSIDCTPRRDVKQDGLQIFTKSPGGFQTVTILSKFKVNRVENPTRSSGSFCIRISESVHQQQPRRQRESGGHHTSRCRRRRRRRAK